MLGVSRQSFPPDTLPCDETKLPPSVSDAASDGFQGLGRLAAPSGALGGAGPSLGPRHGSGCCQIIYKHSGCIFGEFCNRPTSYCPQPQRPLGRVLGVSTAVTWFRLCCRVSPPVPAPAPAPPTVFEMLPWI